MRALIAFGDRLRPLAPVTLRLALAAVFCAFGAEKLLHGMGPFTTLVLSWGLPKWVAPAAAWSGLVGGGLMAVGLLSRLAALACAGVIALVLVKSKLHAGWQGGMDMPVLALAACVSVILSGGGRLSIDRRLFGSAP